MVFSSIPVYLDPPNWQQQHQPNGSESPHQLAGGGTTGSIRPGSMADRARTAKLPPPETALKCPRCESTNTKFCYFNNYSLSQPRHFCKTCRRYWTRGGALRNVPVGGGCRRNKKTKSSRSKSPTSATAAVDVPNPAATTLIPSSGSEIGQLQQPSNLPFMASLQSLGRYGAVGNMGLSLREILAQQTEPMGFQMGGGGGVENYQQWRSSQQLIPNFMNGFDHSNSGSDSGSYQFQSEVGMNGDTRSRVTNDVKLEHNINGALNLSTTSNNLPNTNHNQYYSWTDLSGLASSSTTHLL